MTLFDSILSMLGLKSTDSSEQQNQESTDVTVEHDPDAENEAAVKGTDAAGSTGTMTEEPPEEGGPTEDAEATDVTDHAGTEQEAAEPAEAAGPTTDEPDTEAEPAPVDESPDGEPAVEADEEAAEAETDAGDADTDTEDAAAAGTDAAGSTGSVTEEPPEEGAAAEPAEAAGAVSEEDDEHEAAEPAEAAGPVGEEPDPSEESAGAADDPADTVSGIGPAYASKLADAGVETVGDLAAADPAELAEQTDISEKRLSRLVERAAERLEE
ncbi:helix-hairpin-helix domain-containing protein [Haloglomus litoreum]|uniref:helix-hairpin-helix domain-containing protein n=1 Tax=Haloglomus litoreum TaxID=3034026 RepID=UPI0023E77720|nr:helix-hairpin-helix domain-containing protein [Haloglomus sp. DT116]